MTESAPVLTFGRYKDWTLEEVIEEDPGYIIWLANQSGIRKKVPGIGDAAARVNGSKEDTPTHNKLQARFLDERFLLSFFELQLGTAPTEFMEQQITSSMTERGEKVDEALTKIDARIRELNASGNTFERNRWVETREKISRVAIYDVSDFDIKVSCDAKFETPNRRVMGSGREHTFSIDVLASLRVTATPLACSLEDMWIDIKFPDYGYLDGNNPDKQFVSIIPKDFEKAWKIEVKPTLSDDYPNVLRDMQRSGSDILVVGEYSSEGVSTEQMVEIFRRARIGVIFASDIVAAASRRA